MSRFLQLHLLTSYPPANLNRDDLGRPKTALMGGTERLRVSSQSLKRAWRKSEVFDRELAGHVGVRTKGLGIQIKENLVAGGINPDDARKWARQVANVFGAIKAEMSTAQRAALDKKDENERREKENEELEIEQLAHLSPDELKGVDALVAKMCERKSGPAAEDLGLLRKDIAAADIALFGRMVAASPRFNVEAAAQVAHAISVHSVVVQDDFFTAVDDLNKGDEDRGAGHMGETEFAAGLFYLYLCVDRGLLAENLQGNSELVRKTIAALARAASIVAPTGKQNSFASRARASYALCEVGDQQPRSLSVAFLKPMTSGDFLDEAIRALLKTRDQMDRVYGACSDRHASFNTLDGTGTLDELIACATA